MKTKLIIPTLVLGTLLVGGATASAFFPGSYNSEAFSDFSADQQAAIEEAFTIRQTAHDEAESVLEAAGVDREALHEAMHDYRDEQHEAMKAALESGDYAAFQALVADTPVAESLTEDVFNKLVEAHSLREAGDYEGARVIMSELEDLGIRGFGIGKGHHGDRGMGEGFGPERSNS